MTYKQFTTLIFAIFHLTCFSQIDTQDSVPAGNDGTLIKATAISDSLSAVISPMGYHRGYYPVMEPLFPQATDNRKNAHITGLQFAPGQARLLQWNKGGIVATGGVARFPGMMQIDSGALEIIQSAGNFTFHAGGIVNKYGYFNGLHTQYGLNGSIRYNVTPRLSATVFGEYYFGMPPTMAGGMPMPPSIVGWYAQSRVGMSFDYQINEHWGVQTGVETVQQVGTNKYRAEPVVTPYYKINGKVAIGLPVGQILYHILRH